jgi:NAD(P)-dependent dehydrogenase (short-subunit alcohol dehydrogenase family)
MDMNEKAAIVTGAGKGIGEETALRLGKERVWVCCNS